MYVHVMTNYFCNYNCEYCYLGDLKKSRQVIDIEKLKKQLDAISARYDIDEIHCYGGEITLLDEDFVADVLKCCEPHGYTSWVTNLSAPDKVERIVEKTGITYATSLNEERPFHNELINKVYMMKHRPHSVIQVVTPSLLKKSPNEILEEAEKFKSTYLGFVQYFPSVTNELNYDKPADNPNKAYCDFLKGILAEHATGKYSMQIENDYALNQVIHGNYTPWTNNAIFITPFNEYACILYNEDDKGREHLHILKDLDDFEAVNAKEISTFKEKCGECSQFGYCYAEHMRDWNPGDECCGNKSLIDWYREFRKNEDLHKDD